MLEKWDEIIDTVRREEQISDLSYTVWLKPLKPGKADAPNHVLEVEWPGDPIAVKHISSRYVSALEAAIQKHTGIRYTIDLVVAGNSSIMEDAEEEYQEEYTFERFIVDPNNQAAYEAARQAAVSPLHHMQRSLLIIFGEKGTGKTRLMSTIDAYLEKENANHNALYISGELFVQYIIEAYVKMKREENGERLREVREKLRAADLLLLDGLDIILGKSGCEIELETLIRELLDNGKHVVITMRKDPLSLKTESPRISELIRNGETVQIGLPGLEARIKILRQLNEGSKGCLTEDRLELLAKEKSEDLTEMVWAYRDSVRESFTG